MLHSFLTLSSSGSVLNCQYQNGVDGSSKHGAYAQAQMFAHSDTVQAEETGISQAFTSG